MLGATVRLKGGDGTLYRVRRDGINNYGRRQLRLRALDGGPLLFVEPDEVEAIEPAISSVPEPSTGQAKVKTKAGKAGTDGEDQGAAAADD